MKPTVPPKLDFKVVVLATPVFLPDRFAPTVVGDRILEGACEGVTRMNQEYIRAGLISDRHPYHDSWKLKYARDPRTLGTIMVDGKPMDVREYWAVAPGVAMREKDDCETLSAWLSAWYREVCGVNACCAIYPSITAPGGIVGRHVVVWVPMASPLILHAPYDSDLFIRHVIPGVGYIEDPSAALGMYYVTSDRGPMPRRTSWKADNAGLARRAARLSVPYLPAHWINL